MRLLNSESCIVMEHTIHQKEPMKLLGFLLLVSGWGIVETAFYLLHGNALPAFIVAGLGVEILGLVLVTRAHLPSAEESR
jgi:hypothetical protein